MITAAPQDVHESIRLDTETLDRFLHASSTGEYQNYLSRFGVKFDAVQRARLREPGGRVLVEEGDGGAVALLRYAESAWDTTVLGVRTAKISHIGGPPVLLQRLLRRALKRFQNEGIKHVTVRVSTQDLTALHLLEEAGFRTMDVLNIFLDDMATAGAASLQQGERIVRELEADETGLYPRLIAIGAEAFHGTRISNDPRISDATGKEFYATLTRSLLNRSDTVKVVALDKGAPVGFAIGAGDPEILNSGGMSLGYLWLIAVDKASWGKKIGGLLFEGFRAGMQRRFTLLEVGTQVNNVQALRVYGKAGLRPVAALVSLHLWLDEPGAEAT